ncbi:DUF3270 family protein [Streptococcus hyovaginalis]|uniref:DUF3270 family protein n=2 Tax=Streptococcus hyovaginalis TaxID=149015 RepID=UPI002A8A0A4B|nr:DUF3270 family protein [Streptococcus hyovaginalis]MDY5973616.1 DUF3270 family protein [Streptococcus hyovaginalis]
MVLLWYYDKESIVGVVMASHLKKHTLPDEQHHHEQELEQKYQSYHDFEHNNIKMRELAFFGQIAIFSIFTVLTAFVLLSFNLGAYIAFPIAMLVATALTSIVYQVIITFVKK